MITTIEDKDSAAEESGRKSPEALYRREVLIGSAAVGATLLLPEGPSAAERKTTFTILHTNDMHSAFIGMVRPPTTRRLSSTTTLRVVGSLVWLL